MQSQIEGASLQVNDCVLKAPFSGEIADRLVDPGAFIRPGSAIATIVDRSLVRVVADVPEDPALEGRGYGIGLRKEDEALKARFDEAIGKVMANGTYDRIREKYFPIDIK